MAGDAQFEFGLFLLIDGLEPQLEKAAGGRDRRDPTARAGANKIAPDGGA
jgi:hypothetical protein